MNKAAQERKVEFAFNFTGDCFEDNGQPDFALILEFLVDRLPQLIKGDEMHSRSIFSGSNKDGTDELRYGRVETFLSNKDALEKVSPVISDEDTLQESVQNGVIFKSNNAIRVPLGRRGETTIIKQTRDTNELYHTGNVVLVMVQPTQNSKLSSNGIIVTVNFVKYTIHIHFQVVQKPLNKEWNWTLTTHHNRNTDLIYNVLNSRTNKRKDATTTKSTVREAALDFFASRTVLTKRGLALPLARTVAQKRGEDNSMILVSTNKEPLKKYRIIELLVKLAGFMCGKAPQEELSPKAMARTDTAVTYIQDQPVNLENFPIEILGKIISEFNIFQCPYVLLYIYIFIL
jgi:hypothetical protein